MRTQAVAINTHYEVGKEVRATMERISQTKPEDLPAEPELKKLKAKPEGKELLNGPERSGSGRA